MDEAEFRAFSQFGEDGIIQWLIARVPILERVFVEIGVEDYGEANTRFLAEHDAWRGLIVDAGTAHLTAVSREGLDWRYGIDARRAFVTRENVNEVVAGLPRDLGLLSIDIDGNDYWILEALTAVAPRIIVAEYNSVFGPARAVTVPYDPAFSRQDAHPSWLYFGASSSGPPTSARWSRISACGFEPDWEQCVLRPPRCGRILPNLTAAEAWVESRFRESRGPDGALSFLESHASRRAAIAQMPVVDVATRTSLTVGEL